MSGALEVFRAFLILGLTSFGGPVAHLSYFRRAFVETRGWLSEAEYAGIVGLCQFLPGPASSQTGFCVGLARAGWPGGIAAWVGFTLPSAVLMFLLARFAGAIAGSHVGLGILHGLQLAAIAVVAQAVWMMARGLCREWVTRLLAVAAFVLVAAVAGAGGQCLALLVGGMIGWRVLAPPAGPAPAMAFKWPGGAACLALFAGLLLASLVAGGDGAFRLFAAFYRAGALVFGGGHVVLPLLRSLVVAPGFVPPGVFLTAYGAAQAMPGPLFTVAAYLGAVAYIGPGGAVGALVATVGIFLPGLLLVAGVMPVWQAVQAKGGIRAAVAGLNAAVVGLLGYALLQLIRSGVVHGGADMLIAAVAAAALLIPRMPPALVVAGCVVASVIL